jgi:hypothetical protein
VALGKNPQSDGYGDAKSFLSGGVVPNLASDDKIAAHRTISASSTSSLASRVQPEPPASREMTSSSRKKRSDWDDSVMSWMKRLDVRKLSPGSGEQVADNHPVIATPVIGIRTIERFNPTGLENKRNFDADMAWLKRSGQLTKWNLVKDDQVAHRPEIRSWDESDMSWMKRNSERVAYPFDERVIGSLDTDDSSNNIPEAIRFGHQLMEDKLAETSDVSKPHDDKRKWKSDVTWIKK